MDDLQAKQQTQFQSWADEAHTVCPIVKVIQCRFQWQQGGQPQQPADGEQWAASAGNW